MDREERERRLMNANDCQRDEQTDRNFAYDGAPSQARSSKRSYLCSVFDKTSAENRRVILQMLRPDPRARLLDLGCYDGSWTRELAHVIGTSDVTGVEVVPAIAARARQRGLKVAEATLNGPIPLPDRSFDVIHANQVIEHLFDTDIFIMEIVRMLAPGGYAVISTNNLASLHNIVSLMLGRQPPPAHISNRLIVGNAWNPLEGTDHENAAMAHLRIFSYRGLKDFLTAYGLRPERYRTVGFYPFPVPVARLLTRIAPLYGAYLTCRVVRQSDQPNARL